MLKDLRRKLKNSRARVVILDPIKYLVIGDYLSPKDVAPFVQMFQEMLTELGMCAVVTLPISKPQDSKGLIRPTNVYSIKGATEWVDSATFCLLVEKKAYSKSSDEVTMSFAKHRIASRELNDAHLTFDRATCQELLEVFKALSNISIDFGHARAIDYLKGRILAHSSHYNYLLELRGQIDDRCG